MSDEFKKGDFAVYNRTMFRVRSVTGARLGLENSEGDAVSALAFGCERVLEGPPSEDATGTWRCFHGGRWADYDREALQSWRVLGSAHEIQYCFRLPDTDTSILDKPARGNGWWEAKVSGNTAAVYVKDGEAYATKSLNRLKYLIPASNLDWSDAVRLVPLKTVLLESDGSSCCAGPEDFPGSDY